MWGSASSCLCRKHVHSFLTLDDLKRYMVEVLILYIPFSKQESETYITYFSLECFFVKLVRFYHAHALYP